MDHLMHSLWGGNMPTACVCIYLGRPDVTSYHTYLQHQPRRTRPTIYPADGSTDPISLS